MELPTTQVRGARVVSNSTQTCILGINSFLHRNSHLQDLTADARHYAVRLFITTPRVSELPRWLWNNADMIVLQKGRVSAADILQLRRIYRGACTLQPAVNDRTEVYRVD